jgi:hypothetical protein
MRGTIISSLLVHSMKENALQIVPATLLMIAGGKLAIE